MPSVEHLIRANAGHTVIIGMVWYMVLASNSQNLHVAYYFMFV